MSGPSLEKRIQSSVKDKLFIITFNKADIGNAMNAEEYGRLWDLLEIAAKNEETIATIIQSTGEYFSTGAEVNAASKMYTEKDIDESDPLLKKERLRALYAVTVGVRNFHLSHALFEHPKPLIVAMNGPVVGLSTAIPLAADLVYARDNSFLLTPFAHLGLVAEGGTSYTLPARVGWSIANEALLGAKRIPAEKLFRGGLINELYPASQYTTEQFNEKVQQEVLNTYSHLDQQSIVNIKKLIKLTKSRHLAEHNSAEVVQISERFASGVPTARFAKMSQAIGKKGRSKL